MAKVPPPNNSVSSAPSRPLPPGSSTSPTGKVGDYAQMDEATKTDLIINLIRTLKHENRSRVFLEFNPSTKLSSRTLASVDYVYVIKLSQQASEDAAFVHVVHERSIPPEELQKMVDDAVKVTHESRYANVRKQLAGKTLQAKPQDINASYFPTHVTFFESVLIDRYGFKKLVLSSAAATMEPTIIIEDGLGATNESTEAKPSEGTDTSDRGS